MNAEPKNLNFTYEEVKPTYKLVWADEFDYLGNPDETKWNYDIGGHGWGNRELQYYTNENAMVSDGYLAIKARKEKCKNCDYTSARLVSKSKGDFLYGRIEVKAKLPVGRGTWPAIWMLPTERLYGGWPCSGEIDIMEHVGYDPGFIHASVHTETYNHMIGTQFSNKVLCSDVTDAFHVYSIEWLPDVIKWYLDDQLYFTYKPSVFTELTSQKEWPFDKHFYIILNLAVGGNWGAVKGVDETVFPQELLVDYVRVYQADQFKEL